MESEWWTWQLEKPVRIRYGNSPASQEPAKTVLQLFESVVSSHGNHCALAVKRLGEWKKWSYTEYFQQCQAAAKAFIQVRSGSLVAAFNQINAECMYMYLHFYMGIIMNELTLQ